MANNRKPKFNIGDIVYNKVSVRGSYEPSICNKHEKLTVDKVERCGDTFQYTCGFNGYTFKENELMTPAEYAQIILTTDN